MYDYDVIKCYEDDAAEEEITRMIKNMITETPEDDYIRNLIAKQNGKLKTNSQYYKGNIAEGNWSLIDEADIKILNIRFDADKEIRGKLKKEKDAEYEYIFISSYYAVKTIMLYYMKNNKQAKRIYGLENAVLGGVFFILKYIGGDFKDERIDLNDFVEALLNYERELKYSDDLIEDIIKIFNDFYGKDLILERRIRNYNESQDNWFTVNFYKEKDFLLNYIPTNNYQILGYKDIEKDFKHLQKAQREKAKEKIWKTPNHPNNECPADSETLKGDLEGWFSQRISKKDRLVYKKDYDKKIVYIAAVCGHYDKAPRRTKATYLYRKMKEY